MSLGGFIRRVGYRIRDCVKYPEGSRICSQWEEIKTTLSDYKTGWPKVEKALAECLEYAVSHSEFYRKYKTDRPLKLSDFPVLNKMDFIRKNSEIRNPDFPDEVCHVTSTSGSTGTPFVIAQDMRKRNRVLAELQAFGEFGGYPSHEKMVFIRAFVPQSTWSKFWSNVWQLGALSLSDEKLEKLFRAQSSGTVAILAYASTLDQLTSYMEKNGIKGSDSVKVVFSGSEYLHQNVRERIQRVWPKALAVSRYSNMENGIMGQESGVPGVFHLCWASYYFEILKFDSDEPADRGELGRIVVTDLYNKALPMIRYDTGDVGRLEPGKEGWPVLVDLAGRRMDLIFDTKGRPLSPHAATYGIMCEGETGVRQWQFVQEGEKNYRILFSSDHPEASREALHKKLSVFKRILGEDAQLEIEQVNDIPVLASGKRKMIVQKWKRGTDGSRERDDGASGHSRP